MAVGSAAVSRATLLSAEPPSRAHRFLKDRTEWLAQQFDRDPRTARRRVLEGFSRLAGLLTEQYHRLPDSDFAPDGWYVISLTAVLRMDLDPPVLTEVRTIAAVVDDLDEIVVSLSVPREHDARPDRVRAEVQYGGEVVEEHDTDLGHARFVMRLPRPLALGEQHEYSISFRAVRRSDLRPYYVVSPLRRCDRFVARVRFAPDARPALIWRVNGLPSRLVDDFQPSGETLEPDALGEVRTEFFALRQGLSYGLQWSAAHPPAGAIRQEGETDVED